MPALTAFWLMMASMATAVLPVWRSPMISSRWPRPIGIRVSMALRPVCTGSCTDLRGMMPGAFTSTRRRSATFLIAPLPSIGLPSGSTTRPSRPLPTGTSTMAPVRLTVSPSLMVLSLPKITHADIVGFQVQRHALDAAGKLDHLAGLDIVEAVDAGDAVADADSTWPTSLTSASAPKFWISRLRMAEISAGWISICQFPFMAARKPFSLVRKDESIMREPTFTTRPPSSVDRLWFQGAARGRAWL